MNTQLPDAKPFRSMYFKTGKPVRYIMKTTLSNPIRFLFALCGTICLCLFLIAAKPKSEVAAAVVTHYQNGLDSLGKAIGRFQAEAETATLPRLKEFFATARHRYKEIEWLVEYHYPSTAQTLNGPALPEAEPSEPGEVLPPSGFQVLEETVFDPAADGLRKEILFELSTIANRVRYLQSSSSELELTESDILDALKLNVYRLITKGITGFDSPVAMQSIDELLPSLEGMKTVASFFGEAKPVLGAMDKAIRYVQTAGKDFSTLR